MPYWESAPFWPLLCPDGMTFASFVVASKILPGEIIPGRSGGTLPDTSLLALRISFNPS